MTVSQTVPMTISAKEWNERRFIEKVLRSTANYGRAKLAGHEVTVEIEGYPPRLPTVWRMVLTVQYVEPGPPIKIVSSTDVDGRL